MSMKKELSHLASNLGADLFAIVSSKDLDGAPKGHRPKDILPNAESVIVLGMKLLDAQVDILPSGNARDFFATSPRQDVFAGHTGFVSEQLDEIGYTLARFLEKKGYRAFHQMSSRGGTDNRYLIGLFSVKHAAVQSGLGVFGYHSMVITPQYGPRIRLTAILTDAEIKSDTPLDADFCVSCSGTPCIAMCPSYAIQIPTDGLPYNINKFACCQYMTTRPTCAVCVKVCPVGDEQVK